MFERAGGNCLFYRVICLQWAMWIQPGEAKERRSVVFNGWQNQPPVNQYFFPRTENYYHKLKPGKNEDFSYFTLITQNPPFALPFFLVTAFFIISNYASSMNHRL